MNKHELYMFNRLPLPAVSRCAVITVLIELEGIINSKPLGYTSSDIADPNPITPNMLLMGRRDPSTVILEPLLCHRRVRVLSLSSALRHFVASS